LKQTKPISCAIAFNGHDSSVSVALGRKAVVCIEAERLFRNKKMKCSVPEMHTLTEFALHTIGASLEDVDYWALATQENPWLSSAQNQKIVDQDFFWEDLDFFGAKRRALVVSHHYAHACAYYWSGYDEAVVQTCDGGGDFAQRNSVYVGSGLSLSKHPADLEAMTTSVPYALIAHYLYGEAHAEGRMMALAGFGEDDPTETQRAQRLLDALNQGGAALNGSMSLEERNRLFARGHATCQAVLSDEVSHLKSLPKRSPEVCNFVHALQTEFTKRRVADVANVVRRTGKNNIVLSGGACLNLEANTAVWSHISRDLYVPSCCDDTGQSLGALSQLIVEVTGERPIVALPFLGEGQESPDGLQIEAALDHLAKPNAILLMHNGQAEIGPRALGHRSIIGRSNDATLKEKVSEGLKGREPYRPVAPICTAEAAREVFDGPSHSPFMLHAYSAKNVDDPRIEGVLHADGSARAQTVTPSTDRYMHQLLKGVTSITGLPMLMNTSLNLRGVPIAHSLADTRIVERAAKQAGLAPRIVHEGILLDEA